MQTNTALTLKGIRKARIALIIPILLAFMCVNAQAFIPYGDWVRTVDW